MTYDETKQKLKELQSVKRLLRAKERQIAEERQQISVEAVDYSKERIQGGEATPAQQRYAEHMERLERDYFKLFDKMCEIEDMLSEHLTDLSPIEQAIVLDVYMRGKSWRTVQREYSYSPSRAYAIVNEAIHKISKSRE